jgi:hypothetical protein
MSSDPSIIRTLSGGSPPSSGFSQTTCPRSISTPVRAASVETSRVPDGVTCCQRKSCFSLRVQAGVERGDEGAILVARAEAGATVWAWAARPIRATMTRSSSIRRANAADITFPLDGEQTDRDPAAEGRGRAI